MTPLRTFKRFAFLGMLPSVWSQPPLPGQAAALVSGVRPLIKTARVCFHIGNFRDIRLPGDERLLITFCERGSPQRGGLAGPLKIEAIGYF